MQIEIYCKSLKRSLLALLLFSYWNYIVFYCCRGCCCLNKVAATTTAARDQICSPGVSVASISRYLLVFYYKLFYASTLNKEYIT